MNVVLIDCALTWNLFYCMAWFAVEFPTESKCQCFFLHLSSAVRCFSEWRAVLTVLTWWMRVGTEPAWGASGTWQIPEEVASCVCETFAFPLCLGFQYVFGDFSGFYNNS